MLKRLIKLKTIVEKIAEIVLGLRSKLKPNKTGSLRNFC